MHFDTERPTEGRPGQIRSAHGSKARHSRRFLPQGVVCLEERALLSAFHPATIPPAPAPTQVLPPTIIRPTGHRSTAPSQSGRWTELQNVSFPTVGGQFEQLDVYLPKTPVPAGGRPVLVAIHGGGWRKFDKTGYGRRIASAFVADGYVVVAPDYELSAPGNPTWPVNFEDVQAAVRWVRYNASMLGINPNEIAAIGESAGANLAALLGTDSTQGPGDGVSPAVQAVVAFSTPTDLTTLYSESRAAGFAAAQFLGGSPQQVPANYIAASPIDQVSPGDPPMLLVQGLQDPLIPVSQSRQMAAALTAAGVRNELLLVHGTHDLNFPAHYSNLVPQILEFLETSWKDLVALSS